MLMNHWTYWALSLQCVLGMFWGKDAYHSSLFKAVSEAVTWNGIVGGSMTYMNPDGWVDLTSSTWFEMHGHNVFCHFVPIGVWGLCLSTRPSFVSSLSVILYGLLYTYVVTSYGIGLDRAYQPSGLSSLTLFFLGFAMPFGLLIKRTLNQMRIRFRPNQTKKLAFKVI